MDRFNLTIDNQGRIMLPSWWRKKVGAGPSTELYAFVTQDGGLILETSEQALRRARALVRKYIPAAVKLSDELITDRRAEASGESRKR